MAVAKRLGHRFVFFPKQAAGGVNQAPARFEQARGAVQNGLLQLRLGRHGLWRLAPFQIGAAAQGAQTRARRIDQHPVNLASQALDAVVALVGDHHRVYVRQPTAGQARLERIEPVRRGVEGVKPTAVAHGRANRQRLAAGASTEIDHHLAALGVQQQGQQLRAFVLHLHLALHKGRPLGQRGLALQANAERGIGGRLPHQPHLLQIGQHRIAFFLEGVDAQIERSRLVQAGHQGIELGTQLLTQGSGQPLRQVVAVRCEQIGIGHGQAVVEPGFFGLGQGAFEEIGVAGVHRVRQGVALARPE